MSSFGDWVVDGSGQDLALTTIAERKIAKQTYNLLMEDKSSQISNNTKETHLRVKELEKLLVDNYQVIRGAYKQGDGGFELFQEAHKLLNNK